MAEPLEYVVKDALMMCDKGTAPGFFRPLYNPTTKVSGCLVTTVMDKLPIVNIPSFAICSLTQKPCIPVPTEWQNPYQVKVRGQKTLLMRSCMNCSLGGKIEFVTSGQIPLPADALNDIKAMQEAGAKKEEEGWGWLDTLELVPVVGSIVGAVREGAKGNWGMMALNIGFLAMDIAGLVTFGGTTAASTAAKSTIKAGTKIVAKSVAKTAAKQVGKSGLKTGLKLTAKGAAKAFKSSIDDIVRVSSKGKLCVFACFPAGTKVHTGTGMKNIEEIQVGEMVWTYNEETREVSLQEVVQTMERESDHTVLLYTHDEVIETTAQHPFYTPKGWTDAGELVEGDSIQTKNDEPVRINKVEFKYEPKKVYNFEVGDWHTYFVGTLAWLVHNVCLPVLARGGVEYAQRILKGIKFNKTMEAKLGDEFWREVWLKGMKQRIDSVAKNGMKVISRKATQLSEISFDTAKKYIDEVAGYAKKTAQNTKKTINENAETILQIPKQEKPIPKDVADYAINMGVKIDEVNDVSMDMLKNW